MQQWGLTASYQPFESADNAASAFDVYAGDGMDQFFEEGTETEELADLGDQAAKLSGTTHVGDRYDPTVAVVVQEGTDVYMVIAMGGDDTLGDQVVEMTAALIELDVPDTGIEFREDGSSTGSVLDILPEPGDHELLSGLVPTMDMDLLLEEAPATPASYGDRPGYPVSQHPNHCRCNRRPPGVDKRPASGA